MIKGPGSSPTIAATGLTGMLGQRLRELLPKPGWQGLAVDLTDAGAVESAVNETEAEVIVNLAAYTDVSSAWSQLHDTSGPCFRVNVNGAENLARACAGAGKHFVQVSTDYVFEGTRDAAYCETDEGDARTDWYGFTKRVAEERVQALGGSWAIVRISFPYQQHSVGKEDFIRRIARLLGTAELAPMFDDQVITPTFSDDACRILTLVATTRLRGVFHAVGPEWLTPYEIATKVAEQLRLSSDQVSPGSLRGYIEHGGRPFPMTLRMSNESTSSTLNTKVLSLSQALTTHQWFGQSFQV